MNAKNMTYQEIDEFLDNYSKKNGFYGVESYTVENLSIPYYYNIRLLYVNGGDPYISTLVYDTVLNKFTYCSLGDYIEENNIIEENN